MYNKLLKLRARKIAIEARGKYRDSMGVLKKVKRKIEAIENTLYATIV